MSDSPTPDSSSSLGAQGAARAPASELVVVLDFGGQYTQLIARRVREQNVYCEILPYTTTAEALAERGPVGIILSGGPESVYADDAPVGDTGLFDLGVPILGICYGMQWAAQVLGGEVSPEGVKQFGRAEIEVRSGSTLFGNDDSHQQVWMSHGDKVTAPPSGGRVTASTKTVDIVAFEEPERRLFGVQFHPEVTHTTHGREILGRFLDVCGVSRSWRMSSYLAEAVATLSEQIGSDRVLCALSGGVDSSVVTALLKRAIGDQLTAVFVDNGLLRAGERDQVEGSLRDGLGLPIRVVDARSDFLGALAGITDPEEKRKTIGRMFIEVFEREAAEMAGDGAVRFLAQGTLYPDVIESVSVGGPSATIKTHHNVGGLPERLGFELVEPLRLLFKDEVRELGRELGLPEELVGRHPFPGPGLGVRVLGEVTGERVAILQAADEIFISELRAAGLYDDVSQALAVLLPVKSVGVMGDFRTYDNVVALRSVGTTDFMTADWSRLPHDFLALVANRIVNEVAGVNRVVYDITSKPPGTIEWE